MVQQLSGDSANFEGGTLGIWTSVQGGSSAVSSLQAYTGANSLSMTASTTGLLCQVWDSNYHPCLANMVVAVNSWVFCASGQTLELSCCFYNEAATLLEEQLFDVVVPANTWTNLANNFTTLSSTTMWNRFVLRAPSPTAGDVFFWDDLSWDIADTRAEQLTGDTAIFENGASVSGVWNTLTNCTVANSSTFANSGSKSMAMTVTASTPALVGPAAFYPCAEINPVTVDGWVRPTVTTTLEILVKFYDVDLFQVGSVSVGSTLCASGSFTEITGSVTSPVGTVWSKIFLSSPSATAGDIYYWDDLSWLITPPDPYYVSPTGGIFDGVGGPLVSVNIYLAGNQNTNITTLDHSLWTKFNPADVKEVSITRGQSTEIDQASPGTAVITLDNYNGKYEPLNSASTYYPNIEISKPMQIVARWAAIDYVRFSGWITDISSDYGFEPTVAITLLDSLDQLGRATVAALQTTDFTGAVVNNPMFGNDFTGARIQRILTAGGYTGSVALDTGNSLCEPTSYGDFALTLIQDVVGTELGWIFSSRSGVFTFFDRYATVTKYRSNTVQAVISDTGDDVDMTAITADRTIDTVYNDCVITRNESPPPPNPPNKPSVGTIRLTTPGDVTIGTPVKPMEYQDAVSVAKYGVRTFSGTVGAQLIDDNYAYGMAQFLVLRYKDPVTIIGGLSIDATVQGEWTDILSLEIMDRLQIIRQYGDPTLFTIDHQLLLLGYSEDINSESWTFQFNTVDASRIVQYSFILDTSQLDIGQLGY